MEIDLRSDTVTRPTRGMLDAMMSAKVGDDVFGEDPTVQALEKQTAALFGKESAVFFPSGTMANQAAILAQTRPREEIICDKTSHVYLYEGGGLAFHSGLSVSLLDGDRGRLTASQVEAAIRADNVHYPKTSIVSLENTHNRGGGSIYSATEMKQIRQLCSKHKLSLHLDGARIFNALAEAEYSASEVGGLFDTISICLSKGLGAPVGSVVVMDASLEHEMRRVRKVMGGGMRQAGVLAAAGLYALEHHVARLKDDHYKARILAQTLIDLPMVDSVVPVETNIVVTRLKDTFPLDNFITILASKGIKTVAFGPQAVRMVTHLDFTDDMLQYAVGVLKELK
jgi:threonine aldolase